MHAASVKALLSRSAELDSDSPRLDIEVLLCHVLGKERVFLRAWPEHCLDDEQLAQFEQLLARRRRGEPVAYLIGRREFWSLDLQLNSATLIPRPETEVLVAQALARCPTAALRVLDLGTGSGAIALALASERPAWQIDALDIDSSCVDVASANGERLGLSNVRWLVGDWFSAVQGHYDLIVSNPPYIEQRDPHLEQGDVRFEPRRALVAEQNGMAAIAHIVELAPHFLSAGGLLMFEHGYQQGDMSRDLLEGEGFVEVSCEPDLAGLDRASIGRWRGA